MKRRVRLDAAFAAAPLSRMPPESKKRMREALRSLGDDPSGRARRLDVKELDLSGEGPALLRLRLGDWRAVYAVRARDVVVVRIFHRSEGYGWLERFDQAARSGDE